VDLLDEPRLIAQLSGLERRMSRGGRDSIGHPPDGHDDLANAAAGCLVLACEAHRSMVDLLGENEPYRRIHPIIASLA